MPIGMISSPAHIATNKRIADKKNCIKDVTKHQLKDTVIYTGAVAGTSAAAALTAKFAPNGAKMVSQIQQGVENFIRRFKFDNKSVMKKLESTKVYKAFNALPTTAKAAIGAAVTAATVLLPGFLHHTHAKGAEIEGSYEV